MLSLIFGNLKNKSTWFYTKLFFFMVIPIFGLFYTLYYAFLEESDKDIVRLARGALIVRILVVILLIIFLAIGVRYIMPNIENWINSSIALFTIFN